MKLTLQTIADWTGGTLLRGDPGATFEHVSIDSREAIDDASLFVALRGENFDGHDFVASCGAAGAIVHRDVDEGPANLVRVEDTTTALQALAGRWRAEQRVPVVGITGSNGKTIVKEMLAAIAGRARTTYRSPGSYNSQIGVALSLLGISSEHDLAVIEAGVSKPGEMERLAPMIAPDLGIITNIGSAHAAGFGTLRTTATEKLKLFAGREIPVVFNADDELLRELVDGGISFGEAEDADYRIADVERSNGGFAFRLHFPDGDVQRFELHVPGRHNVWNAAAAIAAADALGIDPGLAREALASFEVAAMRMEMHTTEAGVTLLNDAYSSDPVSAAAALNALVHYAAGARTVAILGDMLDLGASSDAAHREIGGLVHRLGIDVLVCVGRRARGIGEAAQRRGMSESAVLYVESTTGLDALIDDLVRAGDWVLFKGSRAVGLERAASALLESIAPARLHVDLAQIRENVQAIRRSIGPDSGVMAVVKSFGYGNDSNRVSLALVNAGVEAFCVAYPDEGIPLRRHGIDLPILVTNVRPTEVDKIAKYRLTPLVFDRGLVDALDREAKRRGITIEAHVEIDTGMNRLGIEPDDAVAFCADLAARENLVLDGVMTHFAAADEAAADDFTRQQIARFDAVIADLAAAGLKPRVVHAANTAAAWRFPEARYDLVRVGLGLYGVHPSAEVGDATVGVGPALQFVTEILYVKELTPGETVGYGRTWKADEPRRIATIAVGYNDGFPRFMSNGGEVLVGGIRCPVVGNVCMDVSMVDVTAVPAAAAGDEVVVFGAQGDQRITLEEIAARGHTISYELLTNVSPRVRRVFRS